MAIAVNPNGIEFYEAVFKFCLLSAKTVDNYSFVKGAPAVGAYISLDDIAETLKKFIKMHLQKKIFMNIFLTIGCPISNFLIENSLGFPIPF